MIACVAFANALAFPAASAKAHEFWLQPSDYFPRVGEKISVTHHNGQFFHGDTYPYLRAWFRRFVVFDGAGEHPVKGIDGDDPAASLRLAKPGTAILAYVSMPDLLTFKTAEKFKSYLADVGLSRILEQHRARGLPETGVRESYVRCAKALVAVGGKLARDRAVGLPLELVAETPPASLPEGAPLPVRLLHNGKPAPGLMIKVFSKQDRKNPIRVTTDAQGRALIPLPRRDTYLLNAVLMQPQKAGQDVHWTSLWASLTFSTKGR